MLLLILLVGGVIFTDGTIALGSLVFPHGNNSEFIYEAFWATLDEKNVSSTTSTPSTPSTTPSTLSTTPSTMYPFRIGVRALARSSVPLDKDKANAILQQYISTLQSSYNIRGNVTSIKRKSCSALSEEFKK
ncbi:hypothetical protein KOW79_005944 [Hemibagrus wyckioides]|uniref:SEA domain-containing protein n=1 Tax=Hemibagrus wyckioides TaxID=337641 RepID=A0A9D3SMM1_9TELE|nr:hypothetical protein KOW79_005944 [Hemibagrus wyckioides]